MERKTIGSDIGTHLCNRLFFIKISQTYSKNTQIFHKKVKLLQIRNKKLYRGLVKAKTPACRLNGAVYQFLEMDY